jgi:ABC-type bacteriocin/lantibiotic exporter with double-glycine peptidase domain
MYTPFKRLTLVLKPNSREITQVYILAFFKGLVALSLPLGIQSIINLVQGGTVSTSWIVLTGLIALAIALSGYLQWVQMRIMENIQQKLFARAAFDFTDRIPKIRMEALQPYYPPELMNRFFEILTIQKTLSKIIIDLSTAVLQVLFGLILLSMYHVFFAVFSILLVLMVYAILKLTSRRAMESSLKESKYKYQLVSWLEEMARARDSFKLIGESSLPIKNTDKRVYGYLNSREEHFTVLRSQFRLLVGFKILIAFGLLLAGGFLVIQQRMNIGQFVAAEIILLMVIDSIEKLVLNLENVYDLFTSTEKIGNVMELELEEERKEDALHEIASNNAPALSLKQVGFRYPESDHSIFSDLSFDFDPGKKYVIAGSAGSGKSTLMHVLSGAYVPTSGTVALNGWPLSNYAKKTLYACIGSNLKEETIFEGTILDNIYLGRPDISEAYLNELTDVLLLREFISQTPEGLNTQLDPMGKKLPASVIQKILLARMLITRPKLILLEHPIDAILESEQQQIVDYLLKLPNTTLVAITASAYFKENCDHLLSFDAGTIKIMHK